MDYQTLRSVLPEGTKPGCRQKRDFQGLLDYERELVVLTEALSAKVTPEVAAEIMRRPETVVDYPWHVAGDLSSIKLVCFQVALYAND